MTRPTLGRLVQESTAAIIASRLRKAIRDGELPAGAQLGEAQLARELGVSRGPLREGMQRLTQEGLVISIRNRGLFVVELTADDVRDVYVARSAVERAAAQLVLQRDVAAAADQLLAVVNEMRQAADDQRSDRVGDLDLEFHNVLVSLAGSPRLSRTHHTLLTETRMCINALQTTYPPPDERVPEHRAIAEALLLVDPGVVDRLIVTHMADAVTRLLTVVPPS
ncbi:MAG: GntR family transcriptional regulator [Microlunatus sp.]|nr:GntR family transcriptional regulator [Microlunatus sp.]MDN5769567.1 GntR family transcriptional regulator [Microlunatus sp.]MDN5803579.1 GntR family transcriptional regulator [Microlunatus sp.]